MGNNTLTWIHLSDLHMESEDTFNRKIVLEALWQDIKGFVARGIHPDFIAFTGDVSYHGTAQEYDLATKEFFDPLLAVTEVGKDRLFIIPGNHDANWNKTNMLRNPISMIQTEDDIRKLLKSQDERDLLLSPFSSYKGFAHSYLSPYQKLDDPAFAYSQSIKKGDFQISIVGLNSAWLSGFHRDTDGHIQDYGKLALGELQMYAVPRPETHLWIALMHHPFDWLMEVDRIVVEDLLSRGYSIVLRGHLHRSDVMTISSLAGDILVIPSGAVFDSRKSPNAYNIVQVDLDTGNGVVHLRRYNDRRNEWQKDIESTGEERNGQVVFKLPKFWHAATIMAGEPEASKNVKSYVLTFTEECKQDMISLHLTEDDVIALVQGEFQSHLNYFRFDLEDYPLPVRTNYIVYLDKVQQHIQFKRVVPCTRNEAKLASWNDILTLYRRATRMAYREDPTRLLFVKGMVRRVGNLHLDMITRVEKHYMEFDMIEVHPSLRNSAKKHEVRNSNLLNVVPASTDNIEKMGDEIAFHLLQSDSACEEAYKTIESMDYGDITEDIAIGMIVIAFERSLQHLHKIILRYPPVDR